MKIKLYLPLSFACLENIGWLGKIQLCATFDFVMIVVQLS